MAFHLHEDLQCEELGQIQGPQSQQHDLEGFNMSHIKWTEWVETKPSPPDRLLTAVSRTDRSSGGSKKHFPDVKGYSAAISTSQSDINPSAPGVSSYWRLIPISKPMCPMRFGCHTTCPSQPCCEANPKAVLVLDFATAKCGA